MSVELTKLFDLQQAPLGTIYKCNAPSCSQQGLCYYQVQENSKQEYSFATGSSFQELISAPRIWTKYKELIMIKSATEQRSCIHSSASYLEELKEPEEYLDI